MRRLNAILGAAIVVVTLATDAAVLFWLPIGLKGASSGYPEPIGLCLLTLPLIALGYAVFLAGKPGRLAALVARRPKPRGRFDAAFQLAAGVFVVVLTSALVAGAVSTWGPLLSSLRAFGARYPLDLSRLHRVDNPHLSGKVVVVTERGWLHGLTYALNGAIRPRAPSEVGTVVRLRHGSYKAGTYVSKSGEKRADATQEYVEVSIVDLSLGAIVASKTIFGSDPAKSVRDGLGGPSGTDTTGGAPSLDEVLQYLNSLRRTVPALERARAFLGRQESAEAGREFEAAAETPDPLVSQLAFTSHARMLAQEGRCEEAIARLDIGLARHRDSGFLLLKKAWVYVFCSDTKQREPLKAIEIARGVMAKWKALRIAELTSILAEGLAQIGDWPSAVKYAEETLSLDAKANDRSLTRMYQEALERYRLQLARATGTSNAK